jgi:mycofactocin system transcriptional regulator
VKTGAGRTPSALPVSGTRGGRRRATSGRELESHALRLFAERGFEHTTVDDIAHAAGISRRTFFRYYASKNDLVWGGFDREVGRLAARLLDAPAELPLMDALRDGVRFVNRVEPSELPLHRRRMELILRVPALQAHSALRYAAWRQAVADFAGRRLALPPDSLRPQAIAYAALGVALAAYEEWLRHDQAELDQLLDAALRGLATGFSSATGFGEATGFGDTTG